MWHRTELRWRAYLGCVDNLVGQGLGNALEAAEGGVTGALADQVNSLVDSAEGRHIDGLSSDNTTGSDTGGVLAGATVGDSVDEHLEGVLARGQVNDLHGLLDDAHGHLLLTVVAATGNHHGVNETLNDGALDLLEATGLVAASRVGHVHLLTHGLHLQVAGQRDVRALDAFVGPLSEKLGLKGEFGLTVINDDRGYTRRAKVSQTRTIGLGMMKARAKHMKALFLSKACSDLSRR